jgi:rubrerythrin
MSTLIRILFAVLILVSLASPAAAAVPEEQVVLIDLQMAYEGEINAHARYLAFARQADEEGYGEVASLFRAAARAEEIHAENHAVVIRDLGGIPFARVDGPMVRSTRDNLIAAVQIENEERDQMYPEYIANALAAGRRDAVRTLTWARNAEADHSYLGALALVDLEQLKGSQAAEYYVCPRSGRTMTPAQIAACPECQRQGDFEKVR